MALSCVSMQPKRFAVLPSVVLMCSLFLLSACGGGGGGTVSPEPVTPVTPVAGGGDVVPVTVKTAVLAKSTGKLNDTGITSCADFAADGSKRHNLDLSCALLTDSDSDPIPPANSLARIDCQGKSTGQDGHVGRDVTVNDVSDGHAGFSFTKVAADGTALSASASAWPCVKDNVTGLIWEVKTDDGGLHDKDWTYSWYSTDSTQNGGSPGTPTAGICGATSGCDTEAYVKAVNAAGWCGASDWRMPSQNELLSLIDLSRIDPAIDTAYFPNTLASWYWSGTSATEFDLAGGGATGSGGLSIVATHAWYIGFDYGYDDTDSRNIDKHVRLVRSGK